MAQSPDNHDAERRALAEEERKQAEERARGTFVFSPDGKDTKDMQEVLKVAAIAKQVSRTQVSVRVFRDGKLQDLTEPAGHEDIIFTALLMTRQRNRGER